mgnify:CR=1 FL=1
MSYQPPNSDSVDFGVESYNAPASDGVDFGVEQIVILAPDPVVLDLSTGDALVSAQRLVQPTPVVLDLDIGDSLTTAKTLVRPEPIALDLDIEGPFVSPFLVSDEWLIGGELTTVSGLEADSQTTTVEIETANDKLDRWRQFDDRAGATETVSGFGGQFRALDADGQGSVEVRSAFRELRPFKPSVQYLIDSYSEESLGPDRTRVEITLQRTANRGAGFAALDQRGDVEIGVSDSTIGLPANHVGQFRPEGSTTGQRFVVELRVSDKQAAAAVDALGYPDGVVERSVPDGSDRLVDETVDDRQTVTIRSGDNLPVDDGDYLVTGWSLAEAVPDLGSRRWALELSLAEP